MGHSLRLCTSSRSGSKPQVDAYSVATTSKSLLKYQRHLNLPHSCSTARYPRRQSTCLCSLLFEGRSCLSNALDVDFGVSFTPLLNGNVQSARVICNLFASLSMSPRCQF